MPARALAGIAISAASLEHTETHTRIVIESKTEVRFSLFILRYPERVVLELEGVAPDPVLARLADQVRADHPYMKPVRMVPSPSRGGAARLEFDLKLEAEPSIRALKPQAGRGYRLVLDIAPTAEDVPPSAAPPRPSQPVPEPAPARTPRPSGRGDDPNLVLLEMRLDEHVLAESITTYQYGRETLLPLGELARLLTLGIRTQPDQGVASGFVLSEARTFSLNVAQARITLADQTQGFDPALVRLESDDIYVASTLLSRWLPLDFKVDLSSLTLRVHPRERLPLQARLLREHVGAKVGASTAGYQDPGYPRHAMPYRMLGVPFIDQTFGAELRTGNGDRRTDANYTAYLTGDVLGMEAALFASTARQNLSSHARFTLARHDPDANLLGPLRARSVMFGSGVSVPGVVNISSRIPIGTGYGLTLSNRPVSQPTSFDRHTLQGDLPPGWDVELYFNEALVGFQGSRADGRYSFDDQPLAYGPNEFRLVFHGPLGQRRVDTQSFLLEQSGTPPGAFHYAVTQHRDSVGHSRSLAQFEWGLSKHLTGTGGFVRLPHLAGINTDTGTAAPVDARGRLYTNLGLRAFWRSLIASTDFLRDSEGGWLNESGLKTRIAGIAVSYSRTQLGGFVSELFPPVADPSRSRDKVRLEGALPAGFLPRLPATLEVQREQFQRGGRNLAVTGRVSAHVNRTSVTSQLAWQTSGGNASAIGTLQLSHRVGTAGFGGQLGYSLAPRARLETIVLSGDMRLGEAYLLNFGLVRSLTGHETLYTAALNKSLGSYGLGLTTSYSSRGHLAAGVQLFIAMGREPRQEQWRFDALPKADSGSASVRVFLDGNANGVMDAGEEPIENAAITVNAGRAPMRTDAAGIAWLDRLPVRQHVDIALDAQTLEDPYWAPSRKGVRLVPRPGRVAELEFPVVLTSEIDGTVYLAERASKRGIGDVVIELLDPDLKMVSSTKSTSDGYYIVPAVVQGRYFLRVSPEQLDKTGLIDPGAREIIILPDGKFVTGVDFLLVGRSVPDKARSSP